VAILWSPRKEAASEISRAKGRDGQTHMNWDLCLCNQLFSLETEVRCERHEYNMITSGGHSLPQFVSFTIIGTYLVATIAIGCFAGY
jgi:hypothetical protein